MNKYGDKDSNESKQSRTPEKTSSQENTESEQSLNAGQSIPKLKTSNIKSETLLANEKHLFPEENNIQKESDTRKKSDIDKPEESDIQIESETRGKSEDNLVTKRRDIQSENGIPDKSDIQEKHIIRKGSYIPEPSNRELENTSKYTQKRELAIYKRRYWMLFLTIVLAFMSGLYFPEYSSMAYGTSCYYNVTLTAVSWTNSMPNLQYIFMQFPATAATETIGLRWIYLFAALCNTAAGVIQLATVERNSFWVVLVSSFFSSAAAAAVVGVPPAVAARWFPEHQVSRACAIGLSGYQIGISAGSLFPLVVSSDCCHPEHIKWQKHNMAYFFIVCNLLLFLTLFLTFEERPPNPPSVQEMLSKERMFSKNDFLEVAKNKNFFLVMLLNVFFIGTQISLISTLNSTVLLYFQDAEHYIGWMGCLFSLSGVCGGYIVGIILDKTAKKKQVCLALSILTLIAYVVYQALLEVHILWLQFVASAVLGLFLGSFLPLGYESVIELTYPISPVLTSNLTTGCQLLGAIFFTQIITAMLDKNLVVYSKFVLFVPLLLSPIVTSVTNLNYRRPNYSKVEDCSI